MVVWDFDPFVPQMDNAVLKDYAAFLQTFSQISQEVTDDIGRRASGLLSLLEKFDTYFGLKLSHLLFSGTEQTLTTLQKQRHISGRSIKLFTMCN